MQRVAIELLATPSGLSVSEIQIVMEMHQRKSKKMEIVGLAKYLEYTHT